MCIIVIHNPNGNDNSLTIQIPCADQDITTQSLDFTSIVYLLGKLCQCVAKRYNDEVLNYVELSLLLIPDRTNASEPHTSFSGRNISKITEEGILKKVHHLAKTKIAKEKIFLNPQEFQDQFD